MFFIHVSVFVSMGWLLFWCIYQTLIYTIFLLEISIEISNIMMHTFIKRLYTNIHTYICANIHTRCVRKESELKLQNNDVKSKQDKLQVFPFENTHHESNIPSNLSPPRFHEDYSRDSSQLRLHRALHVRKARPFEEPCELGETGKNFHGARSG